MYGPNLERESTPFASKKFWIFRELVSQVSESQLERDVTKRSRRYATCSGPCWNLKDTKKSHLRRAKRYLLYNIDTRQEH